MASLTVYGLKELAGRSEDIARQLPFIVSKALNETGKKLQQKVTLELLPQNFILAGRQRPARGAPWWKPGTQLGFNLKFARKTQGEAMETVLGSRADWLALQETGGTKHAEGGRVAVPEDIRKSKFEIITSAKRPRRVMQRRKAFTLRLRDGTEGIFERYGKRRGDIRLLYVLKESVEVPPILNFEKTMTAEAQRIIGDIFEQEFHKAISSTRL